MKNKEPIAIVGLGCRFPGGCSTPEEFWDLLLNKTDAITEISDDRWSTQYYYHPDKNLAGKTFTIAAGQVDKVHHFSPEFFGISPREAAQMDPQQRLLLEMTWEAFEDGGQIPSQMSGSDCSVFIGISGTDYANNRYDDPNLADSYFMTGNTLSIAANRLSYMFDLHGPSMAIDTACSSSLVALHQGCSSIWSGESTTSLVGAVHLLLSPFPFIGFSKASMFSENGQCKVFDADADGYVRSEGGAVLYLKSLAQAEIDQDPIHAVILGTAVNSDGRNSGLTIPSGEAQAELLRAAYKNINISPSAIDYIEAHGTGTPVGDPIEAAAIGQAIGIQRESSNPLLIGSVKSNIGHLKPASGVAGLLKVVMGIKHRAIPASINHKVINPNIDCEGMNLKIADEFVAIGKKNEPIIMGVNSFGFGGSNAHVIVSEYKRKVRRKTLTNTGKLFPLYLSAGSAQALKDRAMQFHSLLAKPLSDREIYNIFSTVAKRRERLNHGLIAHGESIDEIRGTLLSFVEGKSVNCLTSLNAVAPSARIVFVFSGNGSQWQGMASNLLGHKVFRKSIDKINALLEPLTGWSLLEELQIDGDASRLTYTEIAQPLLFAIQVGIVEMLRAEGVEPDAVVGHSVGEVAAAYTADILRLEDAVNLIFYRSEAQSKTKGQGKMVAVQLSAIEIQPILKDFNGELQLAAINSPKSVTVSGQPSAIKKLSNILRDDEVVHYELELDYGFHSFVMDSVENHFMESLDNYECENPKVDFISGVTGKKIDGRVLDVKYWWDNIREPVQFESALSNLIENNGRIFLEIGPRPVLHRYIRECLNNKNVTGEIISTLRRGRNDEEDCMREAVFKSYLSSKSLEISHFFPATYEFALLPPYPWDRQEYTVPASQDSINRKFDSPLLGIENKSIEGVWINLIDTRVQEYLADHVICSSVIYPAAAYIEMALSASNSQFSRKYHEICNLDILKPMVLEAEESRETKFTLSREDMRFSIESRKRLIEEDWVVHVTGRLIKSVSETDDLSIDVDTLKDRSLEIISADTLYQSAAAMGLDYGPQFQGVHTVWLGDEGIMASINTAEILKIDTDPHVLHPVILDSAFHTLFPLLSKSEGVDLSSTFIPISISEIKVIGDTENISYCLCNVDKYEQNSVTASFLLLDENGKCLVKINQCLFKALPAHVGKLNAPSIYNINLVPKNHIQPEFISPLPTNEELKKFISDLCLPEQLLEQEQNFNNLIMPLFDALASALAERTLHQLGVHLNEFTIESLSQTLGIPEYQNNYLVFLLGILEQDGKASRSDDVWSLNDLKEEDDPVAIWRSLLADCPEYIEPTLSTAMKGFDIVNKLLHGSEDKGSDETHDVDQEMTGFSKQISISDYISQAILEYILDQWPKGRRRLRIAEIKGPSSRISIEFISKLATDFCDYEIIAQHDDTESQASKLYKDYPNVGVNRADVTYAAIKQKFREGEFDIVIVPHCLYLCDALLETFSNLSYLLSSGGVLIIQEEAPSRIANLNLGADPAWWYPTSDVSQLSSKLNDAEDWLFALDKSGFEDSCIVTDQFLTQAHKFLITARRSMRGKKDKAVAEMQGKSCLLVADVHGDSFTIANELKDELNANGVHALIACNTLVEANIESSFMPVDLDGREGMDSLFGELVTGNNYPDHLIYLSDIELQQSSPEKDISQKIAKRAMRVGNLVNQLAEHTKSEGLQFWLITSNAFYAGEKYDSGESSNPSQATLWGMGRVLMNEYPHIESRLIDLRIGKNIHSAARLLYTELLQNDGEEEVVLSNAVRKVFRFQVADRFNNKDNGNVKVDDEKMFHLSFDQAGNFDNLYWKQGLRAAPEKNEIEIRVLASALNFRDLMFTSGLLPAEMIDAGYAGASLGLECSGIVTSVGKGVLGYSPGDEVLAYAPASFSSHVITSVTSVMRKPPSWSFEEAATVPTAFFTIYYALGHLARLKQGERVLIHGATGGVGLAAIQYAHHCDAEIFATAGTKEKRQFLQLLGVEHVFNSRTLDYATQIDEITNGEGVDVVLNTLSGEAIFKNFKLLRPFGRFLELGKRDFYENTKIDLKPFRNNITYFGVDADQVLLHQAELAHLLFDDIMQFFDKGVFRPLAHTVYPLADVQSAFRYMQESKHLGKIVLSSNSENIQAKNQEIVGDFNLNGNGTYLITGGTRGFGLETAGWMISKGAKHLVLIGRSGVNNEEDKQSMSSPHKVLILKLSCVM